MALFFKSPPNIMAINSYISKIRRILKLSYPPYSRIMLQFKVNLLNSIFVKIRNINLFETRIYSQHGEDGIIAGIFSKIKTFNQFFVEFGVGDGSECNTKYLSESLGWKGLMIDAEAHANPNIKNEFITAENINLIFQKYNVPYKFDLLSIDIDGNDYWVWKALSDKYSPRVVIIEYNAKYKPPNSVTIEYDPNFKWDSSDYFGASLSALANLGKEKGYDIICCDSTGTNAFFVNSLDAKDNFIIQGVEILYKPPTYGKPEYGFCKKPSNRFMKNI